jgi:hypothetical protein
MTARHPMSPEMAEIAIGEFLKAIRERLEQAASIAKAPEACVEPATRKRASRWCSTSSS